MIWREPEYPFGFSNAITDVCPTTTTFERWGMVGLAGSLSVVDSCQLILCVVADPILVEPTGISPHGLLEVSAHTAQGNMDGIVRERL
jgi:hypothetical protein